MLDATRLAPEEIAALRVLVGNMDVDSTVEMGAFAMCRLLDAAEREHELAELAGSFVRSMDLWVDHADEMIPAGVTPEKWNADLMSDFRENVRPLLARAARVGQEVQGE